MKKSLLSNLSLKMMSIVLGIIVWLLVVNIHDPIRTVTIPGVTVAIENESYVESAQKMCLVEEDQDVISVKIRGKRSVVDRISPENIEATADLKQIVDMSTTPIMVPITVSCPGIPTANIAAVPQNMSIRLDDMMTQEFIISVSADKIRAARGYEIGALTVTPEKVRITGPQSLIQKIDRVSADVEEITEVSEDTVLTGGLVIIDKNQDVLTERQMEYLKYDISTPSASINVDLWKVRNDVKLQAGYLGEPADGFKVEKISFTPDVISVAGSDEGLQQLTQQGNIITIPDEYIDVSGREEDFETRININDFLPEGVQLVTGASDTAIATASILSQDSQEYFIPANSIQALNVPEGLQVVYETDGIKVRIREGTQNLDDLSEADIKASINFAGREEGTYDIPVTIAVPEGYEVGSSVSTSVKLVESPETGN